MAFLEYRPTTTLFHYCGPGSFDGITANGSLWLSDLQHANDPKELQLAAVLDTVISQLIARSNSPRERAAYASVKIDLSNMRNRFGMYSSSLSLKCDQLPMWQEYTDRGRGFVIGFRPSAFNDMPLRIQRVRYVAENYFDALHDDVSAIVAPLFGSHTDFVARIGPVTQLLTLITAVKDNSWQHEDEIRLLFSDMAKEPTGLPIGWLRDGTEVYTEAPQHRNRDGVDIPYFSKPFGRYRSRQWDTRGAISLVVLGPNNTSSIDDVSAKLKERGYRRFDVVRSRCAFRP
jgi:hypothetical protein